MRAAVLEETGKLVLREVPVPRIETGEVLLRVLACGICGSDIRTFLYGHHALRLPQILGHEIVGQVVEARIEGQSISVGDVVTLSAAVACRTCVYCLRGQPNRCISLMTIGESLPGGFAEYVAIPASTVLGGEVIHVPKTVSYDVATLVEPLACVLNGLDMAGFRPGETILVIGLGAIGCLHILAARARGAGLIIGADVSGRRIELARVCGADEYVNSKERDLSSAVKSQTGGLGVDVVVVACGAAEAQIQALGLVAKGGRVCFFGGLPTHASKIAIDSNRIHYDELTICGAYGARAHHYHNAMTMIASGHWPFEQLITHRVPLECINEGFRKAQMAESLRVIVVPGDDHAP